MSDQITTITIEDSALVKLLERLSTKAADASVVMKAVAEVMTTAVHDNFAA